MEAGGCCVLNRLQSCLLATPLTVAHSAPLSMGFSRQEHYHALLQGIFLTQGSNPRFLHLLHWQAGSLPTGGWVAMGNFLKGSLRLLLEWTGWGRQCGRGEKSRGTTGDRKLSWAASVGMESGEWASQRGTRIWWRSIKRDSQTKLARKPTAF